MPMAICPEHKDMVTGINMLQQEIVGFKQSHDNLSGHIDNLVRSIDRIVSRLGTGDVSLAVIDQKIMVLQQQLNSHLEEHRCLSNDWRKTALQIAAGAAMLALGYLVRGK
jgi:hypothetical protein